MKNIARRRWWVVLGMVWACWSTNAFSIEQDRSPDHPFSFAFRSTQAAPGFLDHVQSGLQKTMQGVRQVEDMFSSSSILRAEPSRTLLDLSTSNALLIQSMTWLGIDYKWGGSSPETGFDCSGFVKEVFSESLGMDLPRTAKGMSKVGKKVSMDDLKPGDLVFFNTMRKAFSHVGIYLGNRQFIHAPRQGEKVRIEDFKPYWTSRFNGARRLLM
jgi:cell wall-associated NlpC family hydrolase